MDVKLSEVQRSQLLFRTLDWLSVVKRCNEKSSEDDGPGWIDVHMLVLSLEHVNNCFKHLHGGVGHECGKRMREFQTEWAQWRTLRNALEHEEEYIAGKGRDRSKVIGELWDPAAESHVTGWSFTRQAVTSFSLFGRTYSLAKATSLALAVAPLVADEFGLPSAFR